MKQLWPAAVALAASMPGTMPAWAQSIEQLQRTIAEKEAEIRQLRNRIETLERNRLSGPMPGGKGTSTVMPDDASDAGNRALERALVRERGIQLAPGMFEVEPNFALSHTRDNGAGFRRDAYGPGIALRAGLPWRSQVELAIPYVVERRRNDGDSYRARGMGDVTLGLSHQFAIERGALPGLIGALDYQASTGRNTLFESDRPVALGSGFRALQVSVTALKRIDPLVFFGTYSYAHNFAETRNGIRVDPGSNHGVRFGTALAASPSTSLRAAFNVTYFDKTKLDGIAITNSDDPVGMLEFGSTVTLTEATALDVAVSAGVTRNAPRFRVGIALPIRF